MNHASISARTLAFTIGVLAAAAALAGPAAVLPAELPAYGRDRPIPVTKIVKQRLDNGLEVWVVPRSGLPRVDFVLAVRGAGLAADDAQHPGFASLLAGLLNEGTETRDSRAIAEAAQALGGSVAASASNDGITVAANALASNAPAMLTLLADVARRPAFPANEVQLAKANALQALKVSEATPGFRAERALGRAIYGDHPYGRTQPSAEAINAASAELFRAEHGKRFRPDRSLLVIAGRIDAGRAIRLARDSFADWQVPGAALPEPGASPGSASPVRLLLERPGSVQATLRLGRPGAAASAADQVPLRLASTLLGGGFSSRINQNLREDKGYTYGASAGARLLRNGGSIVGGADVRSAVVGASLAEFIHEYTKIGSELVGDDELDLNKRFVAGTYLVNNQLQGAVARTLAGNWLVGLPADFFGQFVPLIRKVTAEQVREMGRKYFSPATQSIVVVGDKAAVAEQLKAYGDFSVLDSQ